MGQGWWETTRHLRSLYMIINAIRRREARHACHYILPLGVVKALSLARCDLQTMATSMNVAAKEWANREEAEGYKEGQGMASAIHLGEVLSWVRAVNAKPATETLRLVFDSFLWSLGRWPLSRPPPISGLGCIDSGLCNAVERGEGDIEGTVLSAPVHSYTFSVDFGLHSYEGGGIPAIILSGPGGRPLSFFFLNSSFLHIYPALGVVPDRGG